VKRKLARIEYFILQTQPALVGCLLNHSFMKKDNPTKVEAVAAVNEHAAGIDVGSTSFYVAIGQQRD